MKLGQKADLLIKERFQLTQSLFAEFVVWKVPSPVVGSRHSFKYRLALVHERLCVVRYDNEAGKGDHKHIEEIEIPYSFTDLQTLQEDFWKDVEDWRSKG